MPILNPDGLAVTSFETTAPGIVPSVDSDNCISPLCMTEDQACTTPWCPKPQPVTG